jgi:hypothetical protein
LLPLDYLSNQKQWVNKKIPFKRNNSSHSCRTLSFIDWCCYYTQVSYTGSWEPLVSSPFTFYCFFFFNK